MKRTKIKEKDVQDSLSFTQKIIDRFGPRLAGTDACTQSAKVIEKEMKRHCDTAGIEEFKFSPNAFLGYVKISVVLFIIATIFLFFEYIIPAVACYSLIIAMILMEFVFYLEVLDPFYKKKKGSNVCGVIEPAGEVRQQVIISGHHDSAFVFNFFRYFPRLYRIRLVLGFTPIVVAFVLAWVWLIYAYVLNRIPFFIDALRYGALASLVFVAQLYFFIGKEGTPGAGDNLIATAITLKIAEMFSKKKNRGRPQLKHTRLILLSFDAEESGLRGSRNYAKRHILDLKAMPSYNLNIESIYELSKLKFLISDLNGLRMLSRNVAKECMDISKELGYTTKTFRFLFGAGATDAAEMARAGVEATTIIAMPMSVEQDAVVYHTPDDTVENIEPDAVEAVLKILYAYVVGKDSGKT